MPDEREPNRCVYCGQPIWGEHACRAHADLLRVDPQFVARRRRARACQPGSESYSSGLNGGHPDSIQTNHSGRSR